MEKWFAAIFLIAIIFASSSCFAWDRKDLFGSNSVAGGWMVFDPPGYSEEVWDRMAQMGVTSSRMAASWREIEAVPGVYDWSSIDSDVQNAVSRGIEPYVLVVNTPGWARADGIPSHFGPPTEESAPYFIAFCTALARRYINQVRRYEIWNEQNGCGWEFPPFNQVEEYLPWLRRAYQGLKAGNPNCMVAIGGLDDAEGHSPYFMNPLYALLEGPDDRPFDAVADHPYGSADDLRWKLRQLRSIMVANGDADKPIWLTEWGFWASPQNEAQQAADTQAYLQVLMEPEFAYVTEANLLCIGDFENRIGGFGMCDFNLRPKPVFYTFQSFPRPGQVTIHHVETRNIRAGELEIKWQTTPASDSQVEYGLTKGYGQSTPRNSTPVTNHSVVITGLAPGTEYHFRVKSGGYASGDYRVVTAGTGIYNGGFEVFGGDGIAKGWKIDGQGNACDSARDTGVVHGGSHAQEIYLKGEWGYKINDVIYQQVAIGSGVAYKFSVWTRGDTQDIKRKIGTDPSGGTNPNAPTVIWTSDQTANNVWQRQEVSGFSSADVITVFIKVESTTTSAPTYKVYIDDAELTYYVTTPNPKSLPDGTGVQVSGIVNAGTTQFSASASIQQPNRAWGIRLNTVSTSCSPGDSVIATGKMATVYGERCVMCDSVSKLGSGTAPRPLAMTNAAVASNVGPDTRGLLVRTSGVVTAVNTTYKYFVIDDGSLPGGLPVLYSGLVTGNNITPPSVGQRVIVTGPSSGGAVGGSIRRVIRVRNQADIRVIN